MMILIVGGRDQGKRAFACGLVPGLFESDFGDGRTETEENLLQTRGLCHFESLVRRILSEGEKPADFVSAYLSAQPDAVILSDEIGSGIIPVDPFEEEWREMTGRLLCDLAQKSSAFYRVTCGIGQRLK